MALVQCTVQAAASGDTTYRMLFGFNAKETGGSTAVVQLKDASGGNIYDEYNLGANETIAVTFEEPLIINDNSKTWYFNISSGAVKWSAHGQIERGK